MLRKSIASLLLTAALATFPGQAPTSIRRVDFKNFNFPWKRELVPSTWTWMPVPSGSAIRLVNGAYAFPRRQYAKLLSTNYGSIGGQDVAAVDVLYSSGGTANWHYLYLYRMESGEPKLMGWLRSGSRADGGLVKIAFQDEMLVLDFEDPSKRDGDCCSDGYIRVSYRWQNGKFVEVPPRHDGFHEKGRPGQAEKETGIKPSFHPGSIRPMLSAQRTRPIS